MSFFMKMENRFKFKKVKIKKKSVLGAYAFV